MKTIIGNTIRWLKINGLYISLYTVLALIVISAVFSLYYRQLIVRDDVHRRQIIEVNLCLDRMNTHVNIADLGLRGYMIHPTEQLLDPFHTGFEQSAPNFRRMRELLDSLGYQSQKLDAAAQAVEQYMRLVAKMVNMVKNGEYDEAHAIFVTDPGYETWKVYNVFEQEARIFVDDLQIESRKKFRAMIIKILILQLALLGIGLPILLLAVRNLRRARAVRNKWFEILDESNKRYIFDRGRVNLTDSSEQGIIDQLVENLRQASAFVKRIAGGDYEVSWSGLDDRNHKLNRENLAGELIAMREQMKTRKREDDIRIWTTEGLSEFAGLIRKHQLNMEELADRLTSGLVQYLKIEQGGLFILNQGTDGIKYLDLKGCYAYQRKKYLEKRLEIGEGLVGQCYLEGERIYMTDVPRDYVSITSGLGDTPPGSILIVPLKTAEGIEGVVELASVRKFEEHEILFVERLGESVASALAAVRVNTRTRELLEQSQQQAEEMRAQEEEMRQNMEELQATQEQMSRKNEEVEQLLATSAEKEETLRMQLEAIDELQKEQENQARFAEQQAEAYRFMLMDVLNELPQKVFLKDGSGRMVLANQNVADTHGLSLEELIGKTDFDFVDAETAKSWREQELQIMKKGEERYEFVEELNGTKRLLQTVKKRFFIRPLNEEGLLGIQSVKSVNGAS